MGEKLQALLEPIFIMIAMKEDGTQFGLRGMHETVRLVDHLTEILFKAEYEIQKKTTQNITYITYI